jgi:hypothetical protein
VRFNRSVGLASVALAAVCLVGCTKTKVKNSTVETGAATQREVIVTPPARTTTTTTRETTVVDPGRP